MVPRVGLEPTSLAAVDFKSLAFTSFAIEAMARRAGFEPATIDLEGRYSIQLS